MKKVLKVLMVASLLIMLMPFATYIKNVDANYVVYEDVDAVEVEDDFIPYSPYLPQDWTQDQWTAWGLALELCLIPALDRAQELVEDARAILTTAGVTVSIVPTPANYILTPEQIEVLTTLINHYEALYVRIQNFLYEFETSEMDFEFAITYINELCEELLLLNSDLENELKLIDDDQEEGTSAPSTMAIAPPTEASQRLALPQTGTVVALASVSAVGIALAATGILAARTKIKNKN